jgi:hypothetical protein
MLHCKLPRSVAMPSKFALLIANGRFSDQSIPKITASIQDVEDLYGVLTNKDIGGFLEGNIDRIYDQSLETIQSSVISLFKDRSPDDLLLFYYT